MTAVAPIITLDSYKNTKITNKDLPKILELVAKTENIDYNKLKNKRLGYGNNLVS